jgi:hypothetical protein
MIDGRYDKLIKVIDSKNDRVSIRRKLIVMNNIVDRLMQSIEERIKSINNKHCR